MATGAAVRTAKVFIIPMGSAELQELLTCLKKAETPAQYDNEFLADLIQRFAQQIIELALPNPEPVPSLNGNSSSAGIYACYILLAVALATLGCYKLLKVQGWSFAHVMYVTRHNFKNTMGTLLKLIENISASVASLERLVSEKLGGLDLKMDQLKELSQKILDDLAHVKSELLDMRNQVKHTNEAVPKLNEKFEVLETKQDITNAGIRYLCNHVKDEQNAKGLQSIAERSVAVAANNSVINKIRILGLHGILGEGTQHRPFAG